MPPQPPPLPPQVKPKSSRLLVFIFIGLPLLIIVFIALGVGGLFLVRYAASPHKSAYIGTWRSVGAGVGAVGAAPLSLAISDSGGHLSIRDERGRTFTGTLDWDGNLKTNMIIEVSVLDQMGLQSSCTSTRQRNRIAVTISIIDQNGHLACFPSDVDATQLRKEGDISFNILGARSTVLPCLLQEYEKIR